MAAQPDPVPVWSILGLAKRDPTLLGPAGQQDPTLLALFWSVLGLAWQPDPIALDPAAKPDPTIFGREGNTPLAAIFDEKHSRETIPRALQCYPQWIQSMATMSSTMQYVCVHSHAFWKSPAESKSKQYSL